MGLPKIERPSFSLTLPLSQRKIECTPFKVSDEKRLLMAKEGAEFKQILDSAMKVVDNCMLDASVKELSIMDFEYAFMKLRENSVSSLATVVIQDGEEEIELTITPNHLHIEYDENHTDKIKVGPNTVLQMTYPKVVDYEQTIKSVDNEVEVFGVLLNSIEKVYHEDEVYDLADFDDNEIEEFFNDLSGEAVSKLLKFYETIPRITYRVPYKLESGEEKTFVLEGFEGLFTSG